MSVLWAHYIDTCPSAHTLPPSPSPPAPPHTPPERTHMHANTISTTTTTMGVCWPPYLTHLPREFTSCNATAPPPHLLPHPPCESASCSTTPPPPHLLPHPPCESASCSMRNAALARASRTLCGRGGAGPPHAPGAGVWAPGGGATGTEVDRRAADAPGCCLGWQGGGWQGQGQARVARRWVAGTGSGQGGKVWVRVAGSGSGQGGKVWGKVRARARSGCGWHGQGGRFKVAGSGWQGQGDSEGVGGRVR